MERIRKIIGIKKSKNLPRKDDQERELQLLVRRVILSKYLIRKIIYIDLDVQI